MLGSSMNRSRNAARMQRAAGFTLIEVMIAVVVVAILMSIALPSYQDSMQKARRSDAKAGLMDAANRQESLMLDRQTYTEDMTDLGFGADPMITEEGHYEIDAAACASGTIATCFLLTATPVSGGAQDDDGRCTTLTLGSNGNRGATGTASTECW
tara:strand:- start:21963 stop:22427 length:465 start_codon:yes stop_codon:yes gene_type:complete